MPHDDSDARMLEILLSAVTSVLNGTGAIANVDTETKMAWGGKSIPIDTTVNASIVVSKIHQVDTKAIRDTLAGYAPNKAFMDRLTKENAELRKGPDQAELDQLRRDKPALERQVAQLQGRVAQLQNELIQARAQRPAEPPPAAASPPQQPTVTDDTVARFSMLELD